MTDAGAGIIDVGGESTRPFSDPVTAEEEIRRVERRVEDAERLAVERAESSRAVRERFETLVDALDADLKNLRGVYKREEKREKALRRAAKRIAELESERAPEERTTDLG